MRLKAKRITVLTHFESFCLNISSKSYATLTADSHFVGSDTLQGFKNFVFEIILGFLLDFWRALEYPKFSFSNLIQCISSRKYYFDMNRRALKIWRFQLSNARWFMSKWYLFEEIYRIEFENDNFGFSRVLQKSNQNPKIISKINFLKPCKVSVGVKVLSALIRVYLDNKSFNLHDSTCVRTVMRLAFKRTSNNMHTTSRKNLIAIFRQGVPLISYHHDIYMHTCAFVFTREERGIPMEKI